VTTPENTQAAQAVWDALARESVRLGEGEARSFFEHCPEMSWVARADGSAEHFNARWLEYTGMSAEQLRGEGWHAAHDPLFLTKLLQLWRHSVGTGEPFEMEHPLRGARGEFRWFLTRARAARDEAGAVVRWFCSSTDIQDLQRVRAELRLIAEQAPILIAHWSDDAHLLFANQAYSERFTGSRQVPLGRHARDVVGAATFERISRRFEGASRGETVEFEDSFHFGPPFGKRIMQGLLAPERAPAPGERVGFVAFLRDVTERRQAETELAQQHRLTQSITDNASVALFMMDQRQHCTFMNPAAERMTGFSLGEVLALDRPLHDIIHHTRPDGSAYPLAECPIDRAFPTRAREQGTDVFVHKEGHFYPVSFTASPIQEDGVTVGTVIEVRDVTESARREAWLEAVIDGSPTGIAVFDRELRFVRINPALARMNGMPGHAHLGRTLREVLPVTAEALEAHYREVLSTGRALVNFPVRGFWAGQLWHSTVSIYPIAVNGRVEGVVGMVQYTGDRVLEEERRELLANASRALSTPLEERDIARRLGDLFVPTWADWALVHLLRDDKRCELAAVSALTAEDEQRLRELLSTTPSASVTFQRTAESGRALLSCAERVAPANGTGASPADAQRLGAAFVVSVPMSYYGTVIGTLTLASRSEAKPFHAAQLPMFEEVANRAATAIESARLFQTAQLQRRRADEANRAKDEFLAVLSHELRTPLNAILGWAQLLLTGTVSAEQGKKALGTIERNAKAQAHLIEELLDYTRITSGRLRLEVEELDLNSIVEAAIQSVRPAADAKDIQLELATLPSPATLAGDSHRLQQAIWNLLTNAVKFTPSGGHVRARVEDEGDALAVTVEDTGAGIHPEFLPHVFERFSQQEMDSKRQHGGLGLGLAIVRQVAELHGGSAEAASPGVGLGAALRVRLPKRHAPPRPAVRAVRAREAPAATHAPANATTPLRGLRVLVVDDEFDARELVALLLCSAGARVSEAASAGEAFELLRAQRFDALVSDIGMPGEDGYDLINKVRSLPASRGGNITAIALTAYARSTDRTKALLTGFNVHLTKPVEPADLISVLSKVEPQRLPT
jgi:PAS domain S-box-containing protein